MTKVQFLQNFDLYADAPGAVPRMRELLLQLAVQGKLVSQDIADASALDLVETISAERHKWSQTFRVPDMDSSLEEDYQPYELPSSWVWTKLGKIALQIQYGYTASADPDVTEVRMLRITDIQENRVDWPSVPGCQIELSEAEKYLLHPNDILIARTGGTIGKSFIVPDAPIKSVFASYLIRVVPPRAISARYLKLFLESPIYWTQLRKMSAGTGQPNVNGQALGRLNIPLPSRAEQERIVAKIHELMALCDRLEAQQQERDARQTALARASLAQFAGDPIPINLNLLFQNPYHVSPADLRKAVLALAVQGKLVSPDSEATIPDDWLKKLRVNHRPDKYEGSSNLSYLPESWLSLRVEDVFEVAGGIQKTPHRTPRGNAFPYLSVANVHRGRLDLSNVKQFELEQGELERKRLMVGDLLIIEGNGSFSEIGRCAKWNGEIEYCVHQNHVIRCRPRDVRISDFVLLFLNSPFGVEIMQRLAITSSGLYSLSVGKIRQITIPLPPLAEQRRIVAKVDQLMVLVDQLEAQLATSRAAGEKLMDALVAELTALK